jgi:hypothetical protein
MAATATAALTATPTATATEPDVVMEFRIAPGSYRAFRDAIEEAGPRLKCYKGSVTLVAPRKAHETAGGRLDYLILAVCLEFGVRLEPLASTTWDLLTAGDDTGYEADLSYYIQSFSRAPEGFRPDLAVEILNTGRDTKARRCGEALKIPELWVLDVRKPSLVFLGLTRSGPHKGTYRPIPRSRALPWLVPGEVLKRLTDPEGDAAAFHEDCRRWAREDLAPRHPR